MLEDYEESISWTLRTRSSRIPLRMQEKLETPMAPAMPCKTCKKSKHGETLSAALRISVDKLLHNGEEDSKSVSKSRPAVMNVSSYFLATIPPPHRVRLHKSPGILKESSRKIGCSGNPGAGRRRNSNPDAASSSQGCQKDALLDGRTGNLSRQKKTRNP